MIRYLLLIFIISIYALPVSAQELEEPNLFVFVGEKISVEEFEIEVEKGRILMDAAFRARYKVIKQVYNQLPSDTIEFIAFDHYGEPAFSNYEHVLLYVVKADEGYFHEKYQYSPLYKTKDNSWAAPYDSWDYNHPYNSDTTVNPVPIEWKTAPSFEATNRDLSDLEKYFPHPFYHIDGRTVTAIYGNYLQDLFSLKKSGVLKARGYFKRNTDTSNH